MNNTLIAYIPGWNASSNSGTYRKLSRALSNRIVSLTYDNINPINAENALLSQLDKLLSVNKDVVIVGQSLGGYWANRMAVKYDLPVILINPSLKPEKTLGNRDVNQKYLDMYQTSPVTHVPRTIIISQNDEVVDNSNIRQIFPEAAIHQLNGQSHKLSNVQPVIHIIETFINTLLT